MEDIIRRIEYLDDGGQLGCVAECLEKPSHVALAQRHVARIHVGQYVLSS